MPNSSTIDGIPEISAEEYDRRRRECAEKIIPIPKHITPRRDLRRKSPGRPPHAIRCVETGEVYPSIAAAAQSLGVWATGISEALNDPSRTCKGKHFVRVGERKAVLLPRKDPQTWA